MMVVKEELPHSNRKENQFPMTTQKAFEIKTLAMNYALFVLWRLICLLSKYLF
jgi:hypothetical protein